MILSILLMAIASTNITHPEPVKLNASTGTTIIVFKHDDKSPSGMDTSKFEITDAGTNVVIHSKLVPRVVKEGDTYRIEFKQPVPEYDIAPAWCKNAGKKVPVLRGLGGVWAGRFCVNSDRIAEYRFMTEEELKRLPDYEPPLYELHLK